MDAVHKRVKRGSLDSEALVTRIRGLTRIDSPDTP